MIPRIVIVIAISVCLAVNVFAGVTLSAAHDDGVFVPAQGGDSAAIPPLTPNLSQLPVPKSGMDSESLEIQTRQLSQAPVVVAGDTLFVLYDVLGVFTAEERAAKIVEKIELLINSPLFENVKLTLREGIGVTAVMAGDEVVAAVSNEDARILGGLRQEIAAARLKVISDVVVRERAKRSPRTMVMGTLFTAIATVLLMLVWRSMTLLAYKLKDRLAGRHVLRIAPGTPLGVGTAADRRADRIIITVRTLRLMLQLALLYGYVTFVTGFYYVTQALHVSLSQQVRGLLNWAGPKFVAFLPDLFIIVAVITVTYIVLQLTRLVFEGLARRTIRWPGFRSEWAHPTYRLVSLFIGVIAFIMLWPHLPGSGSPAFAGIVIFLGVLFLVGSAVIGANWIAGMIVGYTVPFRVGDKVRVAGTTGEVISWSLLMTRLRTEKNVEVTIPNALVLSNPIVNFSRPGARRHLILPTTVTLDSEVPWAQAQELLIKAALQTPNVLKDPMPFVIQKKLGPESVVYELNSHIADAAHASQVQSDLHQAILGAFNGGHVVIRDAALERKKDITVESTVEDYLPKEASAVFHVFPPLSRMFRRERPSPGTEPENLSE